MKKIILSLLTISTFAAMPSKSMNSMEKKVKYRTSFGKCPSRAAGTFTLKLVKEFERNNSLRTVKSLISRERLQEKHYVSDYTINYDPMKGMLSFMYDCPSPLMKVQIYKENGLESYEAILVENGKLFDPTYEVLLRSEKKLDYSLPFLAIPVGDMDKDVQKKITSIVSGLSLPFRKQLSEVIISDSKELTMIMSVKGQPSSVFLGREDWDDKVTKLTKIIGYMSKKKKVPTIINLTNPKKVVVKFNE
jgi:hypothetical protein